MRPRMTINLSVGILPDRTCVIYYKVRMFRLGPNISHLLKYSGKLLRIPDIHLTAKCLYGTGKVTSQLFASCCDILPALFY